MTFLITDDVRQYKHCTSKDEVQLLAAVRNDRFEDMSVKQVCQLEDVSKCKVVAEYREKMIVFDVLEKRKSNASLTIHCQDFPLIAKFDNKTNKWKDCSLRKLLNSKKFLSDFESEFASHVQRAVVHTEDYITEDMFWLLSHEEFGRSNSRQKQNKDALYFLLFNHYQGNRWWLRSVCSGSHSYVGSVSSYGYVYDYHCSYSIGVAPACVIA